MAIIIQHPSISKKSEGKIKEMAVGESSFIQHIKYDESNLQLIVTMKNGGQYIHFYVYPQIIDDFMQSPSKGSYYSQVIKGKYPSSKPIDKNIGRSQKNASRSETRVSAKTISR